MRALWFLVAFGLPLAAHAAPPFRDVVGHRATHATHATRATHAKTGQTANFTSISHLIYLNRCAGGCTVQPGPDDALTHHSSIPQQTATLAEYPYGDAAWNSLVQCVRDMYAPFDIQITDQDPGNAPRTELMIAGHAADIGVPGAGGVAPYVPCNGEEQDNAITFVFALETNNADFLCWAAAQETSHVFGLDHELLATDPMTYLSPPVKKPGFQNMAADCGENTPRKCYCGGTKQNSAQFLTDMFGPAHLDPATLAITSPADGAWVKPGFTVRAQAMSQLTVTKAVLGVDGTGTSTVTTGDLVFTAPASLAGGDHVISVDASDSANRTYGGQITVQVTAACDANTPCATGKCLGGYCLPDSSVTGGLGASCSDGGECITGVCGEDGSDHLCTAACDPGMACPDGFECVGATVDSGVCWPAPASSGCNTGGGNSGVLAALGGLGALLALRRRRRAHA